MALTAVAVVGGASLANGANGIENSASANTSPVEGPSDPVGPPKKVPEGTGGNKRYELHLGAPQEFPMGNGQIIRIFAQTGALPEGGVEPAPQGAGQFPTANEGGSGEGGLSGGNRSGNGEGTALNVIVDQCIPGGSLFDRIRAPGPDKGMTLVLVRDGNEEDRRGSGQVERIAGGIFHPPTIRYTFSGVDPKDTWGLYREVEGSETGAPSGIEPVTDFYGNSINWLDVNSPKAWVDCP
jgi:hypothetical protein